MSILKMLKGKEGNKTEGKKNTRQQPTPPPRVNLKKIEYQTR
jgi:hypothetical protein